MIRLSLSLIIFSFALFAQKLEIEKYAPGTFVSSIVNVPGGEVYYRFSEGGKFRDGAPIPQEQTVVHHGGHYEIAEQNGLEPRIDEVYAGGILIEEDRSLTIKITSMGVNGQRTKDYLIPKMYRRWFAEKMAELVQHEVYFEGVRVPVPQQTPDMCLSIFGTLK